MTIFLTKFLTQAQSILQYCKTVRRIEKAGGDFVSFDENVRIQRQNNPIAWDTFNAEQYVVAMTKSNKQPSSTFTPAHKVPRGFCFAFHAGRFCPGCQHSHMCPGCGGSHPSSKCQAARQHTHATHFPQQQQMRGNSPFIYNHFAPNISSPLHHTNLVFRRHKEIPSLSDDHAISRNTPLPTEYHLSHSHLPPGWVPPTPINP